MSTDFRTPPIDPAAAAALGEKNLRLDLVDTDNPEQFTPWFQAMLRGFLEGQPSADSATYATDAFRFRRTTGVWDAAAADPQTPVATVASWLTPLTVPGRKEIPAWAISAVTVSPTHRRKGIATNLLEAELRTAAALGIPLAMLTVSESTIYQRFGFEPAVMASDLKIDTKRAHFAVPPPAGRVSFVPVEELRTQAPVLIEAARLRTPGEIETWPRLWDKIFSVTPDDKDLSKRPRAVRYDDADGIAQGFALYRMKANETDFAAHTATVVYLLAVTDEAYSALWRFLTELDLTSTVTAHLRSVDEPLNWQISDFRAITTRTYDHLWLRILDVKAALEARTYNGPARIALDVTDHLGFAAGSYVLTVAEDGTATVAESVPEALEGLEAPPPLVEPRPLVEPVETSRPDPAPDHRLGPHLTLTVNELSALYLGGVSATTLTAAGRITERTPGDAAKLDAALHSSVTPWLSIWF